MLSARTKKTAGVVVGVAGAGVLTAVLVGTRSGDDHAPNRGGPRIPRFVDGTPATPPAPERPETPEEIAKLVESSMASWRTAIGVRDADTVVKLDAAFQTSPDRYRYALAASAGGDGDERVRAFSTRVLGKFRQADLAETFEKLLQDKSPYVRQNAAWALGELAADTSGRVAAQHALAELRHVKKRDPAGDVRAAAQGAIERLE